MLKKRQVTIKNDYLKLNIQMFADGEISYKVTFDGHEAERTINNLSKSSDTLSKKFSSFGSKMTIGVTAPLTALATAGVKYNATMETYLANLTTLMKGNEKAASNLLQTLKEMAATTPYETTDLVKATQKMMAFGLSASDSLNYLQMLGDIAMGDANKMDSLTLAFSQIGASGRATMEDINQMIDQGFNPLTIISQKTGENMGALRDRVSEGAVSFQEIVDAMKTATSEGGIYFGSMDKASQTTAGKISTLKDDFNSALGQMTESLLPFATKGVERMSKLAQWFANLDDDGKKLVLTLAGIAAAIGPVAIAISNLIKIGEGVGKVSRAIKKWEIATKLQTAAQWLLNAAMNANPLVLIITAIIAIVAALIYAYNKFEWFRDGVNSVFSFIGDLVGRIIDIFNAIIDFFKNNWQTILLFILNPFAGIFKVLYDNFGGFRDFVNTIIESIKNFFLGLFNFIKNIVTTAWTYIYNTFLLIVAIVATILEIIYNIISPIVGFIYNNILMPIFNFFMSILSSIFNLFVSIFTSIYNFISGIITGILSVIGTIVGFVYNNVLLPIFNFFASIFNAIWGVISGVIGWITNGFTTVANVVKSVFQSVKSFISNIFSTIGGIIKAPINGVITLINGVLKQLNKIKVPDWVPGLGGKGINFPMIPKLATGTNYIAREGLAYLHEGEAVVPKKYNPAIGGYGNFNQPIYVTVNADMDVNKFGKAFVRDIKTFSGGTKNSYNYGGGK